MWPIHFFHLRATHTAFSGNVLTSQLYCQLKQKRCPPPPTGLTAHLFLSHHNLKRTGNHFWAAHITSTAKHWPCISLFFQEAVRVYYGAGIKESPWQVPHHTEWKLCQITYETVWSSFPGVTQLCSNRPWDFPYLSPALSLCHELLVKLKSAQPPNKWCCSAKGDRNN